MCRFQRFIAAKRENILCTDVMLIEAHGRELVLTDLFGRTLTVEGTLLRADLTGGIVVIETA